MLKWCKGFPLTCSNAQVNEEDAPGVDWLLEADRQMVSNMLVKMADINGPCKPADLHKQWTYRITEEFYEQVSQALH